MPFLESLFEPRTTRNTRTLTLTLTRGLCTFVGPPSDPRLRRALGTLAQGCPSPEPALQASLRRRLRLGHDPTAQVNVVGEVRKAASDGGPDGTTRCRLSRTPVSKRGSVEQARLQNRDLRRSPGRRMPDGWTRQRPGTAVPKSRGDARYGASPFVWFVWLVATILSSAPAEGAARGRAAKIGGICGSPLSLRPGGRIRSEGQPDSGEYTALEHLEILPHHQRQATCSCLRNRIESVYVHIDSCVRRGHNSVSLVRRRPGSRFVVLSSESFEFPAERPPTMDSELRTLNCAKHNRQPRDFRHG